MKFDLMRDLNSASVRHEEPRRLTWRNLVFASSSLMLTSGSLPTTAKPVAGLGAEGHAKAPSACSSGHATCRRRDGGVGVGVGVSVGEE